MVEICNFVLDRKKFLDSQMSVEDSLRQDGCYLAIQNLKL